MKLLEKRPTCGPHNGTQNSVALPVPQEVYQQGNVTLSWSSHTGADGKPIHSVHFSDEDGNLIASHTLAHDDVKPWDKVLHVLTKFRKNTLRIMDELNRSL